MMKVVISLINEEKLNLSLKNDVDEEDNNVELYISSENYDVLIKEHVNGALPFVVGLYQDWDLDTVIRKPSRLFVVDVISSLKASAKRNEKTVLYATSDVLSKYFPEGPSNEYYLKVISSPIPLSKVIVGIRSAETLEKITSDDGWETKLRVAACNPNRLVFCRMNEEFLGDKDSVVLHCEPVMQGTLDLNTEIVATKLDAFDYRKLKSLFPLKVSKGFHPTTAIKPRTSFSVKILLLDRPLTITGFDTENGAIVLSRKLVSLYGINSNSWFKIRLSKNEFSNRLVKIIESDCKDEDFVYMSPMLWFNLGQRNNGKSCGRLFQADSCLMISPCPDTEMPSFAKEVHIALIQSPEYTGDADYSQLLTHYFAEKRIVHKGDIIGIPLKYDLFNNRNPDLNVSWPVVYFIISRIEGSGCLIDTQHSKLYQTGTSRSFVPSSLKNFYYFNDEVNIFMRKRQTEKLSSLFEPYLKSFISSTASVLIYGPSGSGKTASVKNASKNWNLHLFDVDCNNLLCDTPSATEAKFKNTFNRWSCYSPCVLMLTNFDVLCRNSSGIDPRIRDAFEKQLEEPHDDFPRIIVALTTEYDVVLNSDFGSMFTHHVQIDDLDEGERLEHLKLLFENSLVPRNMQLKEIAKQTAGFNLDDLKNLAKNSIKSAYRRISSGSLRFRNEYDVALSGILLDPKDIQDALLEMQKQYNESIGAPMIPNVEWEDVGALSDVRKEILEAIELPLRFPKLLQAGLKRSGILLYGPPGTGKTLVAKAVASQCNINFLSVKGPEIINMYIGQSEENVRNLFARAKSAAPCVVFFDELDSIAPNRGKSGDSGGVMDRVVSQLLSEIDGVNRNSNVFVIGATNRPDLLDPALLRPGRFDRLVFVGVAKDSDSRIDVLKALTRKFNLEPGFSYEELESKCPPSLTGADFYSICSGAMLCAIGRCVQEVEARVKTEEDCEMVVMMQDFLQSMKSVKPSVTAEDTRKYELIKNKMRP